MSEQEQEATIEDLIIDAFNEGIEAESDEDSIKMAMIQSGATFKNVTRLYNQYMIDAGLAISKADKADIVCKVLKDANVSEEVGFDAAVEALMGEISETTARSAGALIRAYAKKHELEVFAQPKNESTPRSGFHGKYHAFLLTDPTRAEALAFINGEGDNADTSENVRKNSGRHLMIWDLANKIFAQYKNPEAA